MNSKIRYWCVLAIFGIVISLGSIHYLLFIQPSQFDRHLGEQRLTLLNLNEPAPALDALGVKSLPAVIVFCESCRLPKQIDATLVTSSNAEAAQLYGLVKSNGDVGPGYAIIDAEGQVRYSIFDEELHKHEGEINRIVRGTE